MGDGSRCYVNSCNEISAAGSGACERHRFVKHLENASKTVASWPLWMQTILGGKPIGGKPMNEYECKIKYTTQPTYKGTPLKDLNPLTVFRWSDAIWMVLGSKGARMRAAFRLKGEGYAIAKELDGHQMVFPLKSTLTIDCGESVDDHPCFVDTDCERDTEEAFLTEAKEAFLKTIRDLPGSRPVGFYLQNRYQDSGWEELNEFYHDYDEAIDSAQRKSLDSIAYGMVRIVTEAGIVMKTFSCGKECK